MIGKTFSHYKILEKLGEGGMGEVYLAEDTKLDRKVALKFLPSQYISDAELNKRFRREAKAAAALNHPNIITVYEIGEHEGRAFIAMEYVEGESLRVKVRVGQLALDSAVDIALQICEGLHAAHQAGITHRDIKPENVIVDKSGRVRILDFGLAGMAGVSKLTKEGSTLGTISYMAPEQFRGEPVDQRADIWAVGVVLYEMLAGVLPFRGEYEQAVMYMVLTVEPEPVSSLRSDVPEELAAAVHQALAKNANARYQQVDELLPKLKQLQKILEQRKESGSVSATGFRKSAGMQRSRWLRLGLVGVSVVALVTLAIVVSRFIPDRSGAPETPVQIKRLTSFLGNTYAPSWNPDGSMFAYGHTADGPMNIYVMSPGGAPHQLTDTPFDEIGPRWSPTGDKIAFLSDRGNGTEIFWIAPTGGRERKVTNTYIPALERPIPWWRGLGFAPWSRDGEELLFLRMQQKGGTAIWKINIITRQETQLTFPARGMRDMGASWSPDGKWIAFDRSGGGKSAIWQLPVNGGEAKPFIENEQFNFAPAWTPDGSKTLFLSFESGFTINIWEKDLATNITRPVTNQTGGIFAFSLSSRGWLAYSDNGHQADLYWAEVGESMDAHQNLTRNTLNNFGAKISPDGRRIFYYSDRNGSYDIWRHDREAGEDVQLTDDPAVDVLPDLSSKGEVLFVSNRGGKYQLWVTDETGNSPRMLSAVEIPLQAELPNLFCPGPRWSPDGNTVGFIASGDSVETLWLVDAASGTPRQTHLDAALSFDWYLDSERVIYVRKAPDGSGKMELRAAHLTTGEDALLLVGSCAEPVVAPAGDAVAYFHAASHYNMDTFSLPLAPPSKKTGLPIPLGEPRQLTKGNGVWHAHSFTWAPDGKAFVYTRDTDFGDIYAIENYK